MEIIIKNNYSAKFNESIINKAINKIQIDVDTIKKIIVADKIVNFVTK